MYASLSFQFFQYLYLSSINIIFKVSIDRLKTNKTQNLKISSMKTMKSMTPNLTKYHNDPVYEKIDFVFDIIIIYAKK